MTQRTGRPTARSAPPQAGELKKPVSCDDALHAGGSEHRGAGRCGRTRGPTKGPLLILAASLLLPAWSSGGDLPVIREAPPFTLERSDGRQLRLAELRGKVAVMALVYASCTDACPLITGKLALLQRRLQQQKLLGARAVLLTVTFDPERDSREVLQRYARGFRADPNGWFFLRGTPEETRRLLAAYDVWVRPAPDGEFDHSDRIFLIDQAGRIREIYSQRLFSPESALGDILSLLSERIR